MGKLYNNTSIWRGKFLGQSTNAQCAVVQAWNVRPRSTTKKFIPSAEFVESALIFTYGATNIFLEHLGNWGGEWSFEDLEHISITVLFLGGGLVSKLSKPHSTIALLHHLGYANPFSPSAAC